MIDTIFESILNPNSLDPDPATGCGCCICTSDGDGGGSETANHTG